MTPTSSSLLIGDSKTRELIIALEPGLLTPTFVHDEIENYEELIVGKSGMEPDRVAQFTDLLFQYTNVILASGFYAQDVVETYSMSDLIDSFDTL